MNASQINDNRYHPSFLPLLNKIPERGPYSPWAYVEWMTWEGHMHLKMLGDGQFGDLSDLGDGGGIEEMADELIEDLAKCNENQHNGHGVRHTSAQFSDAYRSAIDQLLNKEFDRQHAHSIWLQAMYKKWGGHIPAAVILPTDEDLQLIVPDEYGDPRARPVRPGALDGLLPTPTEAGAIKAPIGYYRKPRWSPKRRLEYLRRKGL